MKKIYRITANTVVLLGLAVLTACGGDTPGTAVPITAEELFVPENAWTDEIPPEAKMTSSDEFLKGVANGNLVLVSPHSLQQQQNKHLQQFDVNRAFLEGLPDRSEALDALLAEAKLATNIYDQPAAILPDGQTVGLLDLATRLEMGVARYKLAHDVNNAIAVYSLSYALLPAPLKAQAIAPDTLRGKTLEQVRAAAQQLNTLLANIPGLDNTHPEIPPLTMAMKSQIVAGTGLDEPGLACLPSDGLYAQHWWPLKKFVSPIKTQGKRGTCWAFSAIAAVESRERVRGNNPVNLSEQFLVYKVKREWAPDDFNDGGSALYALNAAVDHNQSLLTEASWTYNSSFGRPDDAFAAPRAGTRTAYDGACNNYTGTCSKSAHQSREICTQVPATATTPAPGTITALLFFCAYETMEPAGPSVVASRVRQVWATGEPFNLQTYRQLLAGGYSLIGELPIYEAFMAAPDDGIISSYDKKMKDADDKLVDGQYGNHVVQIVGFLSNEELSTPNNPNVNIGGGGYFIIRNSWGCAGDSGYYYVPADYVSKLFFSLQVLEFDGTRSSQWQAEQMAPGSSTPYIFEGTNATLKPDLRVPFDLTQAFKLTDSDNPGIGVQLTITSDVDGLIYNGWWGGASLFGKSIWYTFNSLNYRTLTFTVRYGAQVETTDALVLVKNSPPQIVLDQTGTAQVGEPYPITALITDINETNSAVLCANAAWAVDAPDVIANATGCLQKVTFGATGNREVRISTKDSEGQIASQTLTLNVLPPPENPYPRIASVSLNSREFKNAGGINLCVIKGVSSGTTINLTQNGCVPYVEPTPGELLPLRYFVGAAVENPAGEILTYDWALYVTGTSEYKLYGETGSTKSTFELPGYGNAGQTTRNCRVTLKVNAPDPTRSKSLTAWTGSCTYNALVVN